jgi:hypothetical protein
MQPDHDGHYTNSAIITNSQNTLQPTFAISRTRHFANVLGNRDVQEEAILVDKRIIQNNLQHLLGRDTSLGGSVLESPLGVGLGTLESDGAIGDGAVGGRDGQRRLEAEFADGRVAVADVFVSADAFGLLHSMLASVARGEVVEVGLQTYVEDGSVDGVAQVNLQAWLAVGCFRSHDDARESGDGSFQDGSLHFYDAGKTRSGGIVALGC